MNGTAMIPLGAVRRCKNTGKYRVIVDAVDESWARQFNWTADISDRGQRVYAVRRALCADGVKRKVYMHREIWERMHGEASFGQIDHREHGEVSGLDNRRENLRLASPTQNAANQRIRKDNTSGFRGVSWDKRRRVWTAYMDCHSRRTRLGDFDTAEQAGRAYDSAAKKAFGQFARLNFAEVA